MSRKLVVPMLLGLFLTGTVVAAEPLPCDFSAPLSCSRVGPKPAQTTAVGEVLFFLAVDGNSLAYEIAVDRLDRVTMAHLHLGPETGTGQIVAWLYPAGKRQQRLLERAEGVLVQGVLRAEDLAGAMAGRSIAELVEELRRGGAYVNVHTKKFITGELRGQVQLATAPAHPASDGGAAGAPAPVVH